MKFRKAISILLAVLMVASAASIGGILAYHFPKEKSVNELSSGNIVISEEEQEEVRKEKPERDDSVLEMEDKNPVPDEKLEEYKNNDSSVPAGNLSTEEPKVQEDKSEYFDTDNNIKIPFDQIYPEEFEQGVFEYDDETLMFKVKSLNNKREKELFEAGIIKTEEMMVLEDAVWYVGYVEKDADITAVMEKVRELDFIKVAEYNFKYEAAGSIIDSTEISKNVTGNASVNDQWYLKTCGIQSAWKYLEKNDLPMAGEGVVVAVIDTGVDFDHIDLKSNMWKNVDEIPDNGIDDDGNGYVDDYYGIDIVYGSGNGDDDHGHGTHVAGIIAAANNKEGIVGIAYNAKIMAVKAGQASGYFLQSDIAKAILYAYDNGADVINMSFGGTSASVAVQDALAVAYSRCVLVAAAGNDGAQNEVQPNYPAAFAYVLGVMSVGASGKESGFSNWDVREMDSSEYEVYAPGEEIWSTIPNDKYVAWSGTSMAAPVVSAMAATLRAAYSDRTVYPTKFIYGQIASTSETTADCFDLKEHGDHNIPLIVNEYAALTASPRPEVKVLGFSIFDTEKYSPNNNGDGVIDAGETFELGFTLRNSWGMAKNVSVKIDSVSDTGVENRYIVFDGETSSTKEYGSIGTYSDKDAGKIYENDMFVGWENPYMLSVTSDCPNDYKIVINCTITYENGLDEDDDTIYKTLGKIEVVVRRGTLVPDDISEDMTLTADKLWIVPYSVIIRKGVTVTVEEGANIQFYSSRAEDPYAETGIPYIDVLGKLVFEGTEENPINIYPGDWYSDYTVQIFKNGDGFVEMKFCNVVNPNLKIDKAYNCEFSMNHPGEILKERTWAFGGVSVYTVRAWISVKTLAKNCVIRDIVNKDTYDPAVFTGVFDECIFKDSWITNNWCEKITNCVFLNCRGYFNYHYSWQTSTHIDFNDYFWNNSDSEYLMDFIKDLGVEHYCFENADEINNFWGWSEDIVFFIGLYKENGIGEYCWSNGTEVDDSIKSMIVEGPYKYGAYVNGKIHFDINGNDNPYNGYANYYYNDPEGLMPEEEEFVDKFNQYLMEQEYSKIFNGNAFVNNLKLGDKYYWFTIESFYDPEHYWTLNLGNNYWGTTNLELIEKQIIDFGDDKTLAQLNPGNILTEAPENVWPFVTKAGTIVDGVENVVMGAGEVKFYVEFNRDMDTSIPLTVTYGSSEPYADYAVEGEFVSPRRWEGTAYVSTLIESGTQYFSISNGKAADSFQKLYNDEGRFTFEIDMTEALAMNLQGYATDEGIQLSWFQDDFDTLMGYNVYRSTSEDGYYQRLNDVVIPVDTKEFFDDEVEPGTWYYYNFTVVKTDLTESVPSGKMSIMSKDTMAPDMYHTPIYQAFTGSNLVVSAVVTDNVAVNSVKLYYRTVGAEDWKVAEMDKNNDKYSAIIPSADVTTAGIEYYIEAFDGVSFTYKGSAEAPYSITVQFAVSDNSLGDVDGDGVVTNRDALILLQGINDLYNLNAEEFARADINKNGELEAVEALRILQYVSGKITSIPF